MSIRLPNKILTAPVSFEEAKKVIANLDKKRVPFAKPSGLTTSQRLTQYNSVLSKLDPQK
jgi:hypothetical protein